MFMIRKSETSQLRCVNSLLKNMCYILIFSTHSFLLITDKSASIFNKFCKSGVHKFHVLGFLGEWLLCGGTWYFEHTFCNYFFMHKQMCVRSCDQAESAWKHWDSHVIPYLWILRLELASYCAGTCNMEVTFRFFKRLWTLVLIVCIKFYCV